MGTQCATHSGAIRPNETRTPERARKTTRTIWQRSNESYSANYGAIGSDILTFSHAPENALKAIGGLRVCANDRKPIPHGKNLHTGLWKVPPATREEIGSVQSFINAISSLKRRATQKGIFIEKRYNLDWCLFKNQFVFTAIGKCNM